MKIVYNLLIFFVSLYMIIPIYNCFNPILKEKTKPITHITDEIKILINNMFDTMHNTENGVGLAANQVGNSISMFVIDVSEIEEYKNMNKLIFINPEIISYSEETNFYNEGCLSIPTFYEDVERPISVVVKYFDIDMNKVTQEFTGFLARVVQHEYDHLQGILFFEKLSALKKTLIKNKLKKIRAGIFQVDYDMMSPEGKIIFN